MALDSTILHCDHIPPVERSTMLLIAIDSKDLVLGPEAKMNLPNRLDVAQLSASTDVVVGAAVVVVVVVVVSSGSSSCLPNLLK